MSSQALGRRAVMGTLGTSSEVAMSSQLAATLLSGSASNVKSMDEAPRIRDKSDKQAGQLRPCSFDGVRRASQFAKAHPQRVRQA